MRTGHVVAAVLAALALVITTFAPADGSSAASGSGTSRAAASAFYSRFTAATSTPVGWTGSIDGCIAGTESPASRAATVSAVNAVRRLAGLSPIALNAAHSSAAQQTALVYLAEQALSHDPVTVANWQCGTSTAGQAAKNSNAAYGYAGANSVNGYLDDPGAENVVAGHRRWLLDPQLKTIGTGSTNESNALWVTDLRSSGYKKPTWVTWPTAGYFPSQLEPDGRWSLTGNAAFAFDFSSAKVTVTNAAGKSLTVKKHKQTDGYGFDTLVFEVPGASAPLGTSAVNTYTVTVRGIKKDGAKKPISYSYKVKLFDPTSD